MSPLVDLAARILALVLEAIQAAGEDIDAVELIARAQQYVQQNRDHQQQQKQRRERILKDD